MPLCSYASGPDYYFPLTLSTDYKIGVANSSCGRSQLIRGLAVDSYNYDGLNISEINL